jgi:hypothetical protein
MENVPNGRLWQAIREAGYNQMQFARLVGDHYSKVSLVLHGRYNLTQEKQNIYAAALGKKRKELFD